jgi:hypothetical protein
MKVSGDITKKDLVKLVGYLSNDVARLVREEEIPSPELDEYIINELTSMKTVMKTMRILEDDVTFTEKRERLAKILENGHRPIRTPGVHSTDSVDATENDVLFEFVYPYGRGELVGLFGFTGIGKTTLVLSLVRDVHKRSLKPLLIILGDWTLRSLGRRLSVSGFPPTRCSVEDTLTIPEVDSLIVEEKPDVLILDSMTFLQTPPFPTDKRYLQLAWVGEHLKRLAQRHNVLILTTHQLGRFSTYPSIDDIQDSHSHILMSFDCVLGIGKKTPDDDIMNITTMKVRHHERRDTVRVMIDYKNILHEFLD